MKVRTAARPYPLLLTLGLTFLGSKRYPTCIALTEIKFLSMCLLSFTCPF